MGCKYCYLGTGTDEVSDHGESLSTLKYTVEKFLKEKTIPFNLSFHGGEATAIPKDKLESLLEYAKVFYHKYGEIIKDNGYPLNPVHIKTNLYNFDNLYELFNKYEVSISGSVDLPLSLHEKYRTDKRGRSTLNKITENLKLLAKYPYHKKISCVVTQEHMSQLDQFISDIKIIHYDIGLDMTKFNIMFSFDSDKNDEKFSEKYPGTEMLTQDQQVEFFQAINKAFIGTELEEGLRKHWFKEFTPEFCCSAVNCGDKFFLVQVSGDVYACPRGQSSDRFFYGNVFKDSVAEIQNNGWQTIESIENQLDADEECFQCNYLPYCNQGCVFVREQTNLKKSYTCKLQKELYKADKDRYPVYSDKYIERYSKEYRYRNNIKSFKESDMEKESKNFVTSELYEDENSLASIISKDKNLKGVYSDELFLMEVDDESFPMNSPILANKNSIALITQASNITLKIRQDLFELGCNDAVNNNVHIMLLRNTLVSYGDENREKQEHVVDYNIYRNTFIDKAELILGYYHFDLMPFFRTHQDCFIDGVRNNLYITSKSLREYHYLKQKKNAFYHIQSINLPFPYLEFYWDNALIRV